MKNKILMALIGLMLPLLAMAQRITNDEARDIASQVPGKPVAKAVANKPARAPKTDCVVKVPVEAVDAYMAADYWKEFENIVAVDAPAENNVIYYTSTDGEVVYPHRSDAFDANIVSNTYENGKGRIVFDGELTSIGDYAFSCCSRLSSIEIPNSVTSIGDDAFSCCSRLSSIEIPNSVTSIGDDAFFGCSSLSSVEIPSSVTSINTNPFIACDALDKLSVSGGANFYVENGCLISKEGVLIAGLNKESVVIPNSVTTIGECAFIYCSSLSSVVISNSVTRIGNRTFYGCTSLSSLEISNSVTSIGGGAFSGCSSLSSVEIPNSVTSIGGGAFSGCSNLPIENNLRYADTYFVGAVDKSLTSYTIKDGTKWIGNGAFRGCSSLSSVEIPNSVTSIEDFAFDGCI